MACNRPSRPGEAMPSSLVTMINGLSVKRYPGLRPEFCRVTFMPRYALYLRERPFCIWNHERRCLLYHKLIPVVIGVFAAMLLAGTIALAAPSPGGAPSASNAATGVTTTPTRTVTITGQQNIALAIAKAFSVTVASVMAVRDQG